MRSRVAALVLALATAGSSVLVAANPQPAVASPAAQSAAATTTPTWTQLAHFTNATSLAFGVGNATNADLATWGALLPRGWSRMAVANDTTGNNWWRGTLVDVAYVQVLGRHPSAASSIARVNTLAAGGTRADLYSSLYGSSEFYRVVSGGHAATFLAKLYSGVLNHAPNAAAVSAWTQRMATGMPHATVADIIVRSAEARGVRVDTDYLDFLNRAPAPTIRSHWVTNLGSEDELVLQKSLAVSAEFFADAQGIALPAGAAPPPAPPATNGGRAVSAAETQLGVPYVWGGETPGAGFDCSGLAQWAWNQVGVTIPRTTYQQVGRPYAVPLAQIQPGDLVFYWNSDHVAMYVGHGLVVHAPHTGDVVRFGELDMGTPEHIVRPG
jgi:cell wall-associated NlpC family hydrolase